MAKTMQYAAFYLGREFLGVDVLKVQEVLKGQAMTPVPRAPFHIAGLINLRGQIVTAVDLRRRLGMEDCPSSEEPMNVIVRTPEGPVSLLVDRIGDVLEVPGDSLEPVPENVSGGVAQFLTGVHKMPGSLLAVLDIDRLTGQESEGGQG